MGVWCSMYSMVWMEMEMQIEIPDLGVGWEGGW